MPYMEEIDVHKHNHYTEKPRQQTHVREISQNKAH